MGIDSRITARGEGNKPSKGRRPASAERRALSLRLRPTLPAAPGPLSCSAVLLVRYAGTFVQTLHLPQEEAPPTQPLPGILWGTAC